jgi:hypothetical protein
MSCLLSYRGKKSMVLKKESSSEFFHKSFSSFFGVLVEGHGYVLYLATVSIPILIFNYNFVYSLCRKLLLGYEQGPLDRHVHTS